MKSDEEGDVTPAGENEKSLRTLDLDKIITKHEADSPIGPVIIRRISMGDHTAIQKAEGEGKLSQSEFTRILVEKTVKHKGGESLTDEETDRLSVDPDFLEELIKGQSDLTSFKETQVTSPHDDGSSEKATLRPAVREDGEDADAFLLRAGEHTINTSESSFAGSVKPCPRALRG